MGGMRDEAERITFLPLFPRFHVNDPPLKLKVEMNKEDICYTSPIGSLVTNPKPSSIKHNQYNFKNLTNSDSLEVSVVKYPQTNTDLSLQFCSSKGGGEAVDSKASLNNLDTQELIITECFEDESQKETLVATKRQLYKGITLDGLNKETHKKPKTLPLHEQDVSLCSINASSNDIASVLSDKRLLKMRNYMISQQKVFAVQVFELHRLIMVQKKVAKSPSVVLENKLNGDKDDTMRPLQLQEMSDSKARKTNTKIHKPVTEDYPDPMKPKLPIPSIRKDLVTTIWPQHLLPLPENQWLVPVMYPLDGLVYKPHTGPSPPHHPSASMGPMYGQDSLETAFRFQPPNAKTTVDQTNPCGQFPRWSNTSHVIPLPLKKSQESNYSERHKSTASSPPKKHKLGVVLPLFPTEPTHPTDEYKQKQEPLVRAIKAIPRKPTSASESAARIFLMILKERRDSDHMIS